MKVATLFSLGLASGLSLFGQDASAVAGALAAAKSAEEGYQRLNALVEQMTENYALQQRKIAALADEVSRLREENSRENARQSSSLAGFATKDDLRKLAEKIQELDQKREADKRLILEEIQKLAKVPAISAPPEPKRNSRQEKTDKPETSNEGYYTYTVKQGETLSEIIKAYNELPEYKGKPKLTIAQIQKANPKLDPNLLRPGKEILIPMPASK